MTVLNCLYQHIMNVHVASHVMTVGLFSCVSISVYSTYESVHMYIYTFASVFPPPPPPPPVQHACVFGSFYVLCVCVCVCVCVCMCLLVVCVFMLF